MKNIYFILIIIIVVFGCNKEDTAESALSEFVKKRFSRKLSKSEYINFTTDPLTSNFKEYSDEEFDKFLGVDDLRFRGIKITQSSCEKSSSTCSLTYIVKYNVIEENSQSFKSEVKKIAKMKKVHGKWKISDINNLKTFHNSVKPIDIKE